MDENSFSYTSTFPSIATISINNSSRTRTQLNATYLPCRHNSSAVCRCIASCPYSYENIKNFNGFVSAMTMLLKAMQITKSFFSIHSSNTTQRNVPYRFATPVFAFAFGREELPTLTAPQSWVCTWFIPVGMIARFPVQKGYRYLLRRSFKRYNNDNVVKSFFESFLRWDGEVQVTVLYSVLVDSMA